MFYIIEFALKYKGRGSEGTLSSSECKHITETWLAFRETILQLSEMQTSTFSLLTVQFTQQHQLYFQNKPQVFLFFCIEVRSQSEAMKAYKVTEVEENKQREHKCV